MKENMQYIGKTSFLLLYAKIWYLKYENMIARYFPFSKRESPPKSNVVFT